DLRDLLDRDEREQRSRPGAADLLGEEEAEDPLVAEELDDVPRELVRRVDLGRAGRDPLARHRSNELAQLAVLRAPGGPGSATKCKRAEPGSCGAAGAAFRDPSGGIRSCGFRLASKLRRAYRRGRTCSPTRLFARAS